ncbi:MAG: molybdate ABC transporter substrate-binding protein [Sedimenticolaceae bacterium]
MHILRFLMLSLSCLIPLAAVADEVRVAVASNFAATLHRLAEDFSAATGHEVLISAASTGKHYAQISNGAGFDVFLAADATRPQRLEQEGIGVPGSRFVYAEGRLVLWVPGAQTLVDARSYLSQMANRRLAIANPRLAPYGQAARQVLESWQLWTTLRPRLVQGENVSQALHYVASGNAEAGIVALTQVLSLAGARYGSYRVIPADLHAPISQQALLLREHPAAEAFLDYLRGARARALIREAGYGLPGPA